MACELAGALYLIDVATQKVVASVPAGEFSNGVAVAADGARVYVSSGRRASVAVIDTAARKVVTVIEVGQRVADVTVGQRPWGIVIR